MNSREQRIEDVLARRRERRPRVENLDDDATERLNRALEALNEMTRPENS